MTENSQKLADQETRQWIKQALDDGLAELMRNGRMSSSFVEAKPVWALPGELVIGQVREAQFSDRFAWIIAGECPVDCIASELAATPRLAARHFALKWQLDAARYADDSLQASLGEDLGPGLRELGDALAAKAEALAALVESEQHWQPTGGS